MKKVFTLLAVAAMALFVFSCQKSDFDSTEAVPQSVIDQLTAMGFNPDGIVTVEEGYRIERDIIITEDFLKNPPTVHRVPNAEQYSTNNLVSAGGGRTITVYISAPCASCSTIALQGNGNPSNAKGGNGNGNGGGGSGGGGGTEFSATYGDALDEAIARFNAENLTINFQRVASSGADIDFKRLRKGDERQGILGSAGFPSASGDPYGTINMSGILESTYGLGMNGIATIMAHEMGHCIGFRHTDYFDRSISCGGGPYNEGDGGIGANHIPGTPTGADLQGNGSWMLSCTDGSNRDFTNGDKTALDYLY